MKLKEDNYNAISDGENDNDEDVYEGSGDEEDKEDECDADSLEDDEDDELEDDEDEPPELAAASELTALRESLHIDNKVKVMLKQTNDVKRAIIKKSPVNKLVEEAIKQLNERHGSSTVAIKRFIVSQHPDMDKPRLILTIKRYIKYCLDNGTMEQIKYSFKFTKLYAVEEKEKLKMARKKKKQIAKDKQKAKKKSSKAKKDVKPEEKSETITASGVEAKEMSKTASKTSSSKAAKPDKKSSKATNGKTSKTAPEK